MSTLGRIDWRMIYPPFAEKYRAALADCEAQGAVFFPIDGFRSANRQLELFMQGRTTPGPHAGEPGYPALGLTVTRARPGQSAHQYGVAIDACRDANVTREGLQPDWNLEHYEVLAEAAVKHGLDSALRWKNNREGPHVQLNLAAKGVTMNRLEVEHKRRNRIGDVWLYLDSLGPW